MKHFVPFRNRLGRSSTLNISLLIKHLRSLVMSSKNINFVVGSMNDVVGSMNDVVGSNNIIVESMNVIVGSTNDVVGSMNVFCTTYNFNCWKVVFTELCLLLFYYMFLIFSLKSLLKNETRFSQGRPVLRLRQVVYLPLTGSGVIFNFAFMKKINLLA